jgi:excinuclease ABC subunit C
LAKRFEEIHTELGLPPVRLPPQSPALNVLRSLRDEAHRFAIAYNRKLRAKRIQESVLDDIPGIGPSKKKNLLSVFGSVRRLSAAPEADIALVPGIGTDLARNIKDWLAPSSLPEGPDEERSLSAQVFGTSPEDSNSSK